MDEHANQGCFALCDAFLTESSRSLHCGRHRHCIYMEVARSHFQYLFVLFTLVFTPTSDRYCSSSTTPLLNQRMFERMVVMVCTPKT